MNEQTAQKLLALNREFYQTFALQFSATRQRIQPGVRRILERIPAGASILDLGCGNGELWRELARRGHQGAYVGVDFSPGLLSEFSSGIDPARGLPATPPPVILQADLSSPEWDVRLRAALQPPSSPPPFEYVLAFAVLHHLPGVSLRHQTLVKARALLAPGGRLVHSEWQFLQSERLRARIQPWEAAGLSGGDVDQGDYLLNWRAGGSGLRYVHHFSETELKRLAADAGFRVLEGFASDGEGERLSLYQVWEPVGH